MGKAINSLWDIITDAMTWVVNLLPDSPFQAISNSDVSEFMVGLNWIFPITEILAIMQLWTSAIMVFYIYQAILRWIKAIE